MRHRKVQRFVTALTILLVGTMAASCGAGDGKNDPIRIAVGVDASYAPLFLAAEEGMFEDAGLEVEIVQFGQGGEAVQAIAGKQVQMAGSSDTTILTLMAQNPDLRSLYIYEQSGRYLKVVARDGVDGPEQIKKMGVASGLSEYMARKYFESHDIPLDQVEFVESGPPEMPTLAERGDIDAYLLWEPWPSKGVDLGLNELTDTGSYGYSYVHWMVAEQEWLDEHEDQAADVAQVVADAAQIVADDPSRGAEATHAQTKIPVEDAEQAIELVDWKVRGFTAEDLDSYEQQVEYFVDKGILDEGFDFEPMILTNWYDETKGS